MSLSISEEFNKDASGPNPTSPSEHSLITITVSSFLVHCINATLQAQVGTTLILRSRTTNPNVLKTVGEADNSIQSLTQRTISEIQSYERASKRCSIWLK
jgi:hypothetical protein